MSEVTFAKTFLASLDSRPQKLSPDHIEDARTYPARTPYILPRMSKPMSKRTHLAPGQERSISVSLKSLRNPPLDVKLTSQAPNTSILDVKTALGEQTRIPADKIKILHNKKPVADSKVLKELVDNDATSVEFSVMVMGGAAAAKPAAEATGETAQGPSGKEVVESEAFWEDLHGFLLQRVKDEKQANELLGLFSSAWKKRI